MVHALQDVWRALRPNGLMLDVRCYAQQWPIEALVDGQWLEAGVVDDSSYAPDDLAADAALAQIEREGWFVRERAEEFEIYCYWDTLDAMQHEVNEVWTPACVPDDVMARARALAREDDAQVRVRLHMVISRWRKEVIL
jgi:hypothetical protein